MVKPPKMPPISIAIPQISEHRTTSPSPNEPRVRSVQPIASSLYWPSIAAARFTEPRRSRTINDMKYTLEQIQAYMKEHHQVPPSLHALPVDERLTYRPVDGSGTRPSYFVDRDGVISLISFGADGKPGGDGQDADIIMIALIFTLKARHPIPLGTLVVCIAVLFYAMEQVGMRY